VHQKLKVYISRKPFFEFLEPNTFSSLRFIYLKFLFLGKENIFSYLSILIYIFVYVNLIEAIFFRTNNFRILQPLLLGKLIQYFETQTPITTETAYMLGPGIILCSFSIMIIENFYTFESTHIGMQIRIATCSLMFRKVNNFDN